MVDFDKDIFTETIVLSFEEYNKKCVSILQSIDKQSPFGLTPWAFFCLYLFQLFDYLCSRMTKKSNFYYFGLRTVVYGNDFRNTRWSLADKLIKL